MQTLTRAQSSSHPYHHARRAGAVVLVLALAAVAFALLPAPPAHATGGTHALSRLNPSTGTISAGRKALGSRAVTKAELRIGGETRTVRIRH